MTEARALIEHQGKTIHYVNYSIFKDLPRAEQKENILAVLQKSLEVLKNCKPGSVLTLINVTGLYFDMEIVNAFRNATQATGHCSKKMAIVGIQGIMKAAYNFVVGLTPNKTVRTFTSEEEAKDWLVSE